MHRTGAVCYNSPTGRHGVALIQRGKAMDAITSAIITANDKNAFARAAARVARCAVEAARAATSGRGVCCMTIDAPRGSYMVEAVPVGKQGARIEVRAVGSAPRSVNIASMVEAALYGVGENRVAAIAAPEEVDASAPQTVLWVLVRG